MDLLASLLQDLGRPQGRPDGGAVVVPRSGASFVSFFSKVLFRSEANPRHSLAWIEKQPEGHHRFLGFRMQDILFSSSSRQGQLLKDFLGTLDAEGKAASQLNFPQLDAGFAGIMMNFAYCLNGPFDYASSAVDIEIVP